MSFLEAQVSFLSNFVLILSAIKYNSSILFNSNIIYFGQKQPIKYKFLRFSSAPVKIRQIPHVNFEMTSQFTFKFLHHSSLSTHNSPVRFKLIFYFV